LIIPNVKRALFKAKLTACQTNLSRIATGLEAYRTDHEGIYPVDLSQLLPGGYISKIPKCPVANADTYSSGYTVTSELKAFTVRCKGSNHTNLGLEPDEPFFDLQGGLQPK